MIWFKIIVALVVAILFFAGGNFQHNYRRFVLPCVMALSCGVIAHTWWALLMLTSIGAFCIGYGDRSAFRRTFGPGWGRSVWGLLAAICLSFPLFFSHHVAIVPFAFYLSLNFTLENALKNINQIIGDLLIGLGFSSIVFFLH